MAAIEIDIISIDTELKTCIVTITDNGVEVVTSQNIGLELNPDETANTVWIKERVKQRVAQYRSLKAEQESTNKVSITVANN